MKSFDIINVAGLLMDGKQDGIEKELRKKEPRSMRTIAPAPFDAAMKHPDHAVARAVQLIRETVQDIERQFGKPNVVLVGRSYGAFLALLAAIRIQFQNILKAILIEGPLHPDISVKPPALLPPLLACGIHYEARPTLAREAADRLKELGTSHLVIVQGGGKDDVVPTPAQVIPGDFETIELTDRFSKIHTENGGRGVVVKLPAHIGGRGGGMRGLLPEGYRTHLFWSREKMEMVGGIIEDAAS